MYIHLLARHMILNWAAVLLDQLNFCVWSVLREAKLCELHLSTSTIFESVDFIHMFVMAEIHNYILNSGIFFFSYGAR
jgi:hypothetical protein